MYKDKENRFGTTKTKFWFVWVPNRHGGQNPRVRFDNQIDAEMAAKTIACKEPNKPVYVMEAKRQYKFIPNQPQIKEMV